MTGAADSPRAPEIGSPFLADFLLENHVGFLLRRAHQRHAAIFLDVASAPGLTPTQFAALCKTVELGRVTQNHLGRLVAMIPPRSRVWSGVLRRAG